MSAGNILIDSHVLIWLLYEPEKISTHAQELILGVDTVYLSSVSIWELSLKFSKGNLSYPPMELIEGARLLHLDRLPLRDEHIVMVPDIHLEHSDPFDAMLIAQSEVEGCDLLTADKLLLGSHYRTLAC